MIKVAITICRDLVALQLKFKALYESGQFSDYIVKKYSDSPILISEEGEDPIYLYPENPVETGRYVVSKGLRMPLSYSADFSQSFGLFKCNPYDEDGNLTGLMKAVYPEIQILQYGTNKSLSDCPWDKLTEDQWLDLEAIKPRQPILDIDGNPTGELEPRRKHECATGVCP